MKAVVIGVAVLELMCAFGLVFFFTGPLISEFVLELP